MTSPLSAEDSELDRLWRKRFGEALPILGGGEIVRRILATAGRVPAEDAAPDKASGTDVQPDAPANEMCAAVCKYP